jgi:hypothetical protein
MIKIIKTIHVKREINNQPDLVACFNLLERMAAEKKLLIFAVPQLTSDSYFSIHKVGNNVGDEALFKTTELDAIQQFLDTYK